MTAQIGVTESLKNYIVLSLFVHLACLLAVNFNLDFLFNRNIKHETFVFQIVDINAPKPVRRSPPPVLPRETIKKLVKATAVPKKQRSVPLPADIALKKKETKKISSAETQKQKTKEFAKETQTAANPDTTPLLAAGPQEKITIQTSELLSRFRYYANLVESKIKTNWHPPEQFRELVVNVKFRVFKSGQIGLVTLASSSGNKVYDRLALRTISLCNPFPPLPPALHKNFEEFAVNLRVLID